MMADDIPPLWVRERACALANAADCTANWHPALLDGSRFVVGSMRALMAHIAEHEEPPVDPLLVEARKLASTLLGAKGQDAAAYEILYGKNDTEKTVQAALAGLKRGMELAQRKRP